MDEGAQILTGGLGKPEGFEKGYFVQPTIFTNVTSDMTIAQEILLKHWISIFLLPQLGAFLQRFIVGFLCLFNEHFQASYFPTISPER